MGTAYRRECLSKDLTSKGLKTLVKTTRCPWDVCGKNTQEREKNKCKDPEGW